MMREPSGRFSIRLAKTARPGNWLPVGNDEAIVLVLRAYLPDNPADAETSGTPRGLAELMPTIGRLDCR